MSNMEELRQAHAEQWRWLSHSDGGNCTGGYITALEARVQELETALEDCESALGADQ